MSVNIVVRVRNNLIANTAYLLPAEMQFNASQGDLNCQRDVSNNFQTRMLPV